MTTRTDFDNRGTCEGPSWTRDNNKNNYLYNAANELNENSGWYETFFRGYDPALGRFNSVDPKATMYGSWSPYSYAYNSPVLFNDPLGANPTIDQIWSTLMEIYNNLKAGEGVYISASSMWLLAGEYGGGTTGQELLSGLNIYSLEWGNNDGVKGYYATTVTGKGYYDVSVHSRFIPFKQQKGKELVVFNSGNFEDNYKEAEAYMRKQAEAEERLTLIDVVICFQQTIFDIVGTFAAV